jgi:hypothetical protein
MDKNKQSFWTTVPGILTGLAAVIGAVGTIYFNSHPTSSTPPEPVPHLMGPLQRGFGLDHSDSDPASWVHLTTPEACSDLCYKDAKCKAMTYVKSNQSCWLKYRVPVISVNADEVSAIRE